MGRVGSKEFPKDQNYEKLVANATLAEKTKMDSIINWYEADTWEDALKLAKAKCNKEDIAYGLLEENQFNGNFVSENMAISEISKIADLSYDEKKQFVKEFYTKPSFSQDLRDKISLAFRDNPEEKLIKILRKVHVSWDINQSDKFQMWNDKKEKARNSEHQFDDLLLMQYGEDGATADKIFIDTIFYDLGITIDEKKLKMVFINQQKAFLKDIMNEFGQKPKNPHQALVEYLQTERYLTNCEKLAGEELTTNATAIKKDTSRAEKSEKWVEMDRIPIKELISGDTVVANNMATLIEEQVKANGIDINNLDKQPSTDDDAR